ncbi:Uncharacterized conserved protein YbjT, contains NAD(P)-binding and DUF2867 domains [Halolactibacillus halophilus]|uniref:NAD(P)-dependent oxidoreductase n=1 Tax=Halolactibacillus halophilus TaxID=306540 RepID=A0A1I5SCW0_9BACI|nr:NmrA family NAD(P)-binding protein [Halolactibacillus halophilus]GEM02525.1 NAD(P)-dependent oxidoreductase [Halolactibacillus halophilus]SFP68555.1 Uncharacterized conserved protein YbjT, contains NAD(P)-binding and DUF2867 domains [Halolactibacillus halophilus]
MRVLVTGASGNVGRFVANELLLLGEDVVVAGTSKQKLTELFGNDVEAVTLDFTRPDTFKDATENIDRVFLMRPPHLGKAKDMYPFIDHLSERSLQLVVFLSLMGVSRNPFPPHYRIEKYIEQKHLPYTHVRPGFFMQNISGVHAKEIKEQNKVCIPAGNSETSFIDARDIGLAIAKILHQPEKHHDKAYTLTGKEALTYHQVADILSNVTGKKINYEKPSMLAYRKYYIEERQLDPTYVTVTMMLYLMTRLGTAKAVTADFSELTGKEPTSFKQFALDHVAAFK